MKLNPDRRMPKHRPAQFGSFWQTRMKAGTKAVLTRDATLRYDSYGAGRPDGRSTKTLPRGTTVQITKVVDNPKSGQTHTIHVNNEGWIRPDAVSGGGGTATTSSSSSSSVATGKRGVLTRDANLRYDSYGSGRPDGRSTQTLKAGTTVDITRIVDNPKPGQTHPIHVNNAGWISADAVRIR